MGASGNVHFVETTDRPAWEALQRCGVRAYYDENFLDSGRSFAWMFRGDCPEHVAENLCDLYELVARMRQNLSKAQYPQPFRAWITAYLLEHHTELDPFDFRDVDESVTVGEFLALWSRAIGSYYGAYEVWT